MQGLARYLGFGRKLARTFGPYLLVEILLPGGSLIALALFVYRRKRLPFGLRRGTQARDRGWNYFRPDVDSGFRYSTRVMERP